MIIWCHVICWRTTFSTQYFRVSVRYRHWVLVVNIDFILCLGIAIHIWTQFLSLSHSFSFSSSHSFAPKQSNDSTTTLFLNSSNTHQKYVMDADFAVALAFSLHSLCVLDDVDAAIGTVVALIIWFEWTKHKMVEFYLHRYDSYFKIRRTKKKENNNCNDDHFHRPKSCISLLRSDGMHHQHSLLRHTNAQYLSRSPLK